VTTRLILVRHGRPRHHEAGVAGGPLGDTGLTDAGRDDVERCGARYLPFRHRLGVSVAPASITEWVTDGDTTAGGPADGFTFVDWRLVRLNDTGHLEG
jgi:broad specificity phosphatase PhoE